MRHRYPTPGSLAWSVDEIANWTCAHVGDAPDPSSWTYWWDLASDFECHNDLLKDVFGFVPTFRRGGDRDDDVLKVMLGHLPVHDVHLLEFHYSLWWGRIFRPSQDTIMEACGLWGTPADYRRALNLMLRMLREHRNEWLIALAGFAEIDREKLPWRWGPIPDEYWEGNVNYKTRLPMPRRGTKSYGPGFTFEEHGRQSAGTWR